jgi:hypothetical protein
MNLPWSEIIARYERVSLHGAAMQGMLTLARYIELSPLASGLSVTTSMFDLCIAQAPTRDVCGGPYLRISPNLERQIEFRFIDTFVTADQWRRIVEPEHAIPRLLKFLDQLRWFPPEALRT